MIRATKKEKEHIRNALTMARNVRLGIFFSQRTQKEKWHILMSSLVIAMRATNDVNRTTRKIHYSHSRKQSHNVW